MQILLRLLPGRTGFRRSQLHARSPRFRQSDGDRLLGRSCAMFSFSDVLDLFAHELASLRRGRFALRFVASCTFNRLFFRHRNLHRSYVQERRLASMGSELRFARFSTSVGVTGKTIGRAATVPVAGGEPRSRAASACAYARSIGWRRPADFADAPAATASRSSSRLESRGWLSSTCGLSCGDKTMRRSPLKNERSSSGSASLIATLFYKW